LNAWIRAIYELKLFDKKSAFKEDNEKFVDRL
jgi:hypothetical protein